MPDWDRGRGPVLVFVHGLLVNANLWRKVVPRLEEEFRCIVPDWPLGAPRESVDADADLTPAGLTRWIAGINDNACVLRQYSSKVRIPRSQRITFGFPALMMYSAARRNSSIVALIPRLSRTGLGCYPTALSRI